MINRHLFQIKIFIILFFICVSLHAQGIYFGYGKNNMIHSGTSTPFKNGTAIKIDVSVKTKLKIYPTISYRYFEFPGNTPGIIGHGLEINGVTIGFRRYIFSTSRILPYFGISLGYARDKFQSWEREPEYEPLSVPSSTYHAIASLLLGGIDVVLWKNLLLGMSFEYWGSSELFVSRTNYSNYISLGYRF